VSISRGLSGSNDFNDPRLAGLERDEDTLMGLGRSRAAKLLFLALRNVETKWKSGVRHWKKIYNQLIVYFGYERLNPDNRDTGRAQNS